MGGTTRAAALLAGPSEDLAVLRHVDDLHLAALFAPCIGGAREASADGGARHGLIEHLGSLG